MDPFIEQLIQHRSALLRTARTRLHNGDWAEDAVSETMLAALERRPDFHEASRVRAWLFGILKHKLVDQLRHHLGHETADEAHLQSAFAAIGTDPFHCTANAQFQSAFVRELSRLPDAQALAFVRREWWGEDAGEICASLGITTNNLWVMIHRARVRLRPGMAHHRS